jgi:ribosomal protein S18 acetylase RimI-like enzyme
MSESRIVIRKAKEEDCEALLELIRELAIFEKAPQEVTVTLAHFKASGFSENPVWWALVACVIDPETQAEKIIGMALYYIRYSTWKGQRMYLEDIIVTEAWRSKGIGRMLMSQLIFEAKQKNLPAIMWQVLDWNTEAIKFYKRYNATFDQEWLNVTLDISK